MTRMTIKTAFGDRASGVDRQTVGLIQQQQAPHQVLFLDQTHSRDVIVVNDVQNMPLCDGDAVVTRLPDLGLAIKTADCAPVMLFDETAGVIAAVHSGWQGTLQDIVTPTIAAMLSQGAMAIDIQVVIGPCLQQNRFLMGADVYQKFTVQNPAYADFFRPAVDENDKYLFDNAGLIAWQLRQNSVSQITTDQTCTLTQSEKYYSYRARHTNSAHDTMRNVSMIWQNN